MGAIQAAHVGLHFDRLLAALEPLATVLESRFDRSADGDASVAWSDGRVTLSAAAGESRMTLRAASEAKLANLREAVGYYAQEAGVAARITWQAGRPVGLPGNMMLARIMDNRQISPSFRRLRLSGDFSHFATGAPHFRLNFGPAGADLPHCDETGTTFWPGGMAAWHRPPYTVRAMDTSCRWIDVDIVLHEGGRVTDWLSTCQVGEQVALTGPGGKAPGVADWIGYVGDETAMPVIAQALTRLSPKTRGAVRLLVPDPRDRQTLDHPDGVEIEWLTHDMGLGLSDAVMGLEVPQGCRHVFVAGERHEIDRARTHLLAQGLSKTEFQAAAYWLAPDPAVAPAA
ncbi:siderophore-interacting protein [Paracoccus sp. TK19116]|uniref:Siderophore-interacting protein n=1 Tax=Paracoccus albicereus TaxID=2922394 RepID=A0ABT1MS60_9RHOB|nr:siderophore-interacting protein [Paracoccus albicereus]MCQ0971128.1 siderophore-interacting protein [Paracoccus albicereus]